MRRVALLLLAIVVSLAPAAAGSAAPRPVAAGAALDSIAYAVRIANNNLCGITTTNYGFLGNTFASRSPSFEYPLGSGYDHMPRGGLWIGAHAIDELGSFTGVTTAALDGTAGMAGTEFTPACVTIRERSALLTSSFYDPEAVSEEDLISFYSDEPALVRSPENHRPLNVLVRQESYDWSFLDCAHFVIFHYVITNLGAPLQDVYVGLYTELASGNKNLCSSMPPSAGVCTGGSWFKKKWVQYDDSLRLFREHYCYTLPVPSGCNLAAVPAWAAVKLLGVSPGSISDPDKHVTLAAWTYSPGDTTRNQDVKLYAIMSRGTIQDLSGPDFQPYTGDPCELLAVGPFATIASGDSIAVDFALVGGAEIADVQQHARAAQRVYDAGYDATVPVEATLVSCEARPGAVRLRWFTAAGAGTRWTVQRSVDGTAWPAIGAATSDGAGYAVYEDGAVDAGARYGYRLVSPSGESFGEAWVEVPRAPAFALLGAQPNPAARSGLRVAFTLAEAGPVRIEILDTAGRRVLARDLGALAPGAHLERLERAGLAPGTYFVRLLQAARSATRAVVLLD